MGCGQQTRTNELPQTQNQIEQKAEESQDVPAGIEENGKAPLPDVLKEGISFMQGITKNMRLFLWEYWQSVAVVLVLAVVDWKYDVHGEAWEKIRKAGTATKDGVFWLGRQLKKPFTVVSNFFGKDKGATAQKKTKPRKMKRRRPKKHQKEGTLLL